METLLPRHTSLTPLLKGLWYGCAFGQYEAVECLIAVETLLPW